MADDDQEATLEIHVEAPDTPPVVLEAAAAEAAPDPYQVEHGLRHDSESSAHSDAHTALGGRIDDLTDVAHQSASEMGERIAAVETGLEGLRHELAEKAKQEDEGRPPEHTIVDPSEIDPPVEHLEETSRSLWHKVLSNRAPGPRSAL